MNIYSKKQRWKWALFIIAVLIIFTSLWYTNNLINSIKTDERAKARLWADAVQKQAKLVKYTNDLFSKIKIEERKKAELYAEATKQLSDDNANIGFVLKVIQDNTTIPVILTNEKNEITPFTLSRNLDSTRTQDTAYLRQELNIMKNSYAPVVINVYKGLKNYLYYKDSKVFSEIKSVFDNIVNSFIKDIVIKSAAVTVIYTNSDQTKIIASGKIDSIQINSPEKLQKKLNELTEQNQPIPVDLGEGNLNYIFYAQSDLLTKLQYYPYVQFGVIGLFLLIAYILFSTARKAEQDQVWVGMSKETAHQLGTPLSSLMGWNEHLRGLGVDETVVNEMTRDIQRLNTITERFSKIGSQPTLQDEDVCMVMKNAIDYLKKRTSKNVAYELVMPDKEVHTQMSVALFEWVVENLCKNAVDAMDGKGQLKVTITEIPEGVAIDIKDSGKGIPKSKFKTVFEPGFTTKQRGWGLGLSLCKRIIENYHKGKIFVLSSEANKGTTFRIVLNRY